LERHSFTLQECGYLHSNRADWLAQAFWLVQIRWLTFR